MSEKKSELLLRYESMVNNHTSGYFDTDEIDEISFQYELDDEFQKALDVVEYGLCLHPDNPELNLKKVKYLLQLDRMEDADALLGKLPLDSEMALLLQTELFLVQSDLDSALSVIDTLLSSEDLTLDACFDVIDLLLDFASLDHISGFVSRAVALFPEGEADLYRELAAIYEAREEYGQVVDIYNRLLDKDPYSVADWFNLAKVQALQKDYYSAVDACDFALTISEGDESLLSFKGYCYYDAAIYDKAIETFLELLNTGSEKSVVYELIAECYMKQNNCADAIRNLDMAVKLDGNNASLYYQLATNYYDSGNREMAFQMLFKSLELNPDDYDAYSFVGELYLQDNESEKALEYLQKAYSLMPEAENGELLGFFGDAYAQLNRHDEAISYFERALEKDRYNVKLLFRLIMAYFNVDDQEKVSELVQRLESYTSGADELTDITEENRVELKQVKQVLESLKDVLRDALDEKL